MTDYTTRPAQFRLPPWASEFLAAEAQSGGVTKTQVLLDALDCLRRSRQDAALQDGYVELRDVMLEETREWDPALMDGLEDESW